MAYIPKLALVQDKALPYIWYVKAASDKTRKLLQLDEYFEVDQHASQGLAVNAARLQARRSGYGKVSIDRVVVKT
jgi:hypothetical protein